MRTIDATVLSSMKSPIRELMRYAPNALINVAPECEAAFLREYDEFTLEYLDTPKWVCEVDAVTKHIKISNKVFEIFWANALAFYYYWTVLQDETQGNAGKSVTIDIQSIPELKDACQLLQWAFSTCILKKESSWPVGMPTPIDTPEKGTPEYFAQEVSMIAIAFFLHHELSHIRLHHGKGPSDVDTEKDADFAATDWILNCVDENSPEFLKRAAGIATAVTVLVAGSLYTGYFDGDTHPRTYDRLFNILDRNITRPDHPIWYILTANLTLFMDNTKYRGLVPKGPFDTARDCVNAHVEVLNRIASTQ